MTPRRAASWADDLATVFAVSVLIVGAVDARAAVILTGDEEVIVEAHEVIEDDLVVWATYVRIDGVVKGDLVALAEDLVVEGIVEGDVHALAKTVYLNGGLNDDVRLLAYAIALGEKSRVADDAFMIAYSVEAREESRVGGTLFAASRQALLSGQVTEDVFARTGALRLSGLTGGDVRAIVGGLEGVTHSQFVVDLALEIPELPEGLTVASTAAVGGDVDYRARDAAIMEPGFQIAGAIRHEPWQDGGSGPIQLPAMEEPEALGDRGGEALERLAVLLILGLPLALLATRWLDERARRLRAEPMGLLGWGFAGFVFTGLLCMILGIAFGILMVLGLSVGLGGLALTSIVAGALTQGAIFALFFLSIVYLAPVLASAGIGQAIVGAISRMKESDPGEPAAAPGTLLVAVVIGAVVYTALRAVPGVGPLVGIAAALAGLGALARWLQQLFSKDA
jgi:hypothetical protein